MKRVAIYHAYLHTQEDNFTAFKETLTEEEQAKVAEQRQVFDAKVKKLKEVRTDAVRAGFMECQRNNQGSVILAVAEILPANVIEEDEQLQMIYDMAEMRAE